MIVTAGIELIVLMQFKTNNECFLPAGKDVDTQLGENERCLQSSIAQKRKKKVHTLDHVFRFFSPVVYVVFCIVYFGYYFGKEKQTKN